MFSVSVAVMAHPRRAIMVEKLLSRLDRPASVVWDEKNDRIDTGIRALQKVDPSATHHMVVQDDAMVPFDLIAGMEKILHNKHVWKTVPLCLYAGNAGPFSRVFNTAEQRKGPFNWIIMKGLNWGVCVVIPRLEIEPMIQFMLKQPMPQYDLRMSRYFESRKLGVWYPIPSLVDHHDSPSLLEGHGDGRHAWKFVGEDSSALDFPEEVRYVTIPMTRRYIK